MRGAWIEIEQIAVDALLAMLSLPVRGAWIEIVGLSAPSGVWLVAPRAGSVD